MKKRVDRCVKHMREQKYYIPDHKSVEWVCTSPAPQVVLKYILTKITPTVMMFTPPPFIKQKWPPHIPHRRPPLVPLPRRHVRISTSLSLSWERSHRSGSRTRRLPTACNVMQGSRLPRDVTTAGHVGRLVYVLQEYSIKHKI